MHMCTLSRFFWCKLGLCMFNDKKIYSQQNIARNNQETNLMFNNSIYTILTLPALMVMKCVSIFLKTKGWIKCFPTIDICFRYNLISLH